MTMTLQTLLDKANRKLNVSGMKSDVAEKTRAVISQMHAQGIYICVAQGFRSFDEQDALYAQGRTKPGSIVTNARGGQSNHNYGVAVDLCLYTGDGSDVMWNVDGPFRRVIAAMKAQGFKWGGDWTSFKDYPHFELCNAVGGESVPSNGSNSNDGGGSYSSGGSIGTAYIEGYNVNLRSGPGTGYDVLRKLQKGESYIVWVERNGWLNLGGDQWVYNDSSYIRYVGNSAPVQSENEGVGVVTITADVLRVRTGPGTSYDVVKNVYQGERYQSWGYKDGWYNVGGDQWVSGDYVRFEK
ncbi:M15 family metallopeptidase [Bacillus cytotoxicus]|uniref:M15 family metallopeptidase n=1 Tax=Bacillus cytotoxicus TaxID=580165 RepID=A0ACC6A7M3_9BACI|nr:M15 family metallopeptidase [Bacillus cytotoxicus]